MKPTTKLCFWTLLIATPITFGVGTITAYLLPGIPGGLLGAVLGLVILQVTWKLVWRLHVHWRHGREHT